MITTPYEKIQNDLRSIPKDQLMSMGNNPSPQYPTYMIATEMQRRVQEEKAMAAQQTRDQAGQPTVVEGVMDEFANTDGLSQAQPMMEMNQQMPEEGIQMMAMGGRVGYQVGGATQITGKNINILRSLKISDDELKKRGYNIDGINNMASSDVTKLAEEIVKDRVSVMDELFYPTRMSPTGEETIDVQSMIPTSGTTAGYGGGFAGFSNIGQDLISDSTTPTLFPTDEVEGTAAFRQDRGGIRGYFGERGAKTSTDIFNFIASNPQAFEIYNNAGGNANPMAGLEAVRLAGLLGDEADASQFSIANQQQRILKGSPSSQNAGLSMLNIPPNNYITDEEGNTVINPETLTSEEQVLGLAGRLAKDYEARGGEYEVPTFDDRRTTNRTLIEGRVLDSLNLELSDPKQREGLMARIDRLQGPQYELPTERERQSELSGMGLALLGKAIGGARNLGEAAVTIGEGVPELGKLKKGQRDEANAVAQINRSMEMEEIKLRADAEQLINQTRNADNQTRMHAEGLIQSQMQISQTYNMHADKMTKDWAGIDIAHKELFIRADKNNIDAAEAIVKLDLLKQQIKGDVDQQLNKTYELLLDQVKQVTETTLDPEKAAEDIEKISKQIDYILSRLLPESATTTVQPLGNNIIPNIIDSK